MLRIASHGLLAVCLLCGPVNAADDKTSRDSLRNLSAVLVVVESVDADTVRDGLTTEQIQTDVELRLRKAGVVVSDSASPMLYVAVNPVYSSSGIYAYSSTLQLEQPVTILSNNTLTMATTWSILATGLVGRNKMPAAIRSLVGDQVDTFLNAYLSAHQKQ
jgi:hypothetical protein